MFGLALLALAGCAEEEDAYPQGDVPTEVAEGEQEVRESWASDERWLHFDSLAGEYEAPIPEDVVCDDRRPRHFDCTAYVEVRDGEVALIAHHAVEQCGPEGLWGRLVSAPEWLRQRLLRRIDTTFCGRRSQG